MRRLPVLIAFTALTLLAFPAVVAAADPTPVPVVDPSAVPSTDPTAAPVLDPAASPAADPASSPAVVDATPDPAAEPSAVPGEPSAVPGEPPVECAPDAADCTVDPIVYLPMPCPTGVEVCPMAGGVVPGGPAASDLPLVAPAPAGGMFFSISTISDGTTSYDVAGNIAMGPDGLTATVGCNTIAAQATWDVDKGTLTITGEAVSTKMACMGDPGAAEALLVQLLGAGVVSWDGSVLTGGGITAQAMVAMADGLAPVDLTIGSDGTAGSGGETTAVTSPVAAASGTDGMAWMVLLGTAAALVVLLVAGGLVARRAARQG